MKSEIIDLAGQFAKSHIKKPVFIPGKTYIRASGASLSEEDIVSLVNSVLQMWYTEWKQCRAFRQSLSNISNKPYVMLCNSGSSANLLAITAAIEAYRKGKFVVTCASGFPTTVAPIYQNNKIPIFIDIDPKTLSPNYDQFGHVMEVYKDNIAGVVLTHTLGFPFDEWKFWDAMDRDQFLIVDCADALGAELLYEGEMRYPVGHFGDLVTYSFFPAHQIFSGEGGAVLIKQSEVHDILRSYSNWGRDCRCLPGQDNVCGKRFEHAFPTLPNGYDHKYIFTRLGYNLKMTEFQAALGVSQLSRLHEFVSVRKRNFYTLQAELFRFSMYLGLIDIPEWSLPSPFGFPIFVRDNDVFTANDLIQYLESHKIGTRRMFGGNLTRQPAFANLPYIRQDLSGSDVVMNNMFWLGVWPGITEPMIEYMVETIWNFFKEKNLV